MGERTLREREQALLAKLLHVNYTIVEYHQKMIELILRNRPDEANAMLKPAGTLIWGEYTNSLAKLRKSMEDLEQEIFS